MNIEINVNGETYSYLNSEDITWKEIIKIIKMWAKEDLK